MAKLSLWQNRNFRQMFTASAATNLGDGLSAVAVAWLATLLTHDPLLIGGVATARTLPWFLFALPAGVITDRFDHRRIIIGADCLRIMVTLGLMTLALCASPGTGPVLLMTALSFILGSAEVLRDNTAQTFTPAVVEKSQLEQANGAMWSAEQLSGQFIGPPLAGLLIGFSVALPFAIQAAMLACTIALIASIRVSKPVRCTVHLPATTELKEGVLWLWRDVPLCRLAFILGGFNFIGYGYAAILVLYSQRVLGLDALGFGMFLTLPAIGGLAATVIGPRILRHIAPRSAILLGMTTFTSAAVALALQAPLWLVTIFVMLDGFSGMLWNIAQVSYRQRHIPAPLLGRVNSAFRFIGTGPAAFGAFTFGWLVSWAGSGPAGWSPAQSVALPYGVAAAVAGTLTVYAAARLRLPSVAE